MRNVGYTKEDHLITTVSRQSACRGPSEGILTIPWFPITYNITRKGLLNLFIRSSFVVIVIVIIIVVVFVVVFVISVDVNIVIIV